MSGLDWFPTLLSAAGDATIVDDLRKGKKLGERNYRAHLDGYDQVEFITGKSPSKRNEVFYFAESTFGAVRIGDYKFRFIDQPNGWLGGTVKPDIPIIVNLRLDPYERTGLTGALEYMNWFMYQFWRCVFVQDLVMKWGETFLEFPPLQKPASFNLEAVKEQLKSAAQGHAGK
jgi:arylsulfatase